MILAFVLMLQTAPPPPPAFGGHLFPAPIIEKTAVGQCGKADATVRIVQRAATAERVWSQSVAVAIGRLAISEPDSIRLNEAVAKFGAISSMHIDCAAGEPAQLRFNGPVSGIVAGNEMAARKVLLVDIQDTRITAIR